MSEPIFPAKNQISWWEQKKLTFFHNVVRWAECHYDALMDKKYTNIPSYLRGPSSDPRFYSKAKGPEGSSVLDEPAGTPPEAVEVYDSILDRQVLKNQKEIKVQE